MLSGQRQILNIPAGVNKDDNTLTSMVYTDADKIRFHQGFPEKIGGWYTVEFANSQTLSGVPRTIFSFFSFDGTENTLIGTHSRLYVYQNGSIYNITPLVTSTTAIANSLATNFQTLGTNPIATTNGSRIITVTYTTIPQATMKVGDYVQINGEVGAIGGIPQASMNQVLQIASVTPTTIGLVTDTTATSTATGGGAAVTLGLKVLNVSQIGHGFTDGSRVKITDAGNTGGIVAANINVESIIRNVSTNAYSIYLEDSPQYATSSVTAAGGASTKVQGQIASGNCTNGFPVGYGGGAYGDGAYGAAKIFSSGYKEARIWSIDKYENGVVLTAGGQTGVYEWDGDITVAPTLVTNAPTAVNYVFVAANQIVTLGASGIDNRIYACNSQDKTDWTVSYTTDVFLLDLVNTGTLLTHSYIKDQFLIFSKDSVYSMQYVGLPDIWLLRMINNTDGIMSVKAVSRIPNGVVWAGQNDFYIYNGSIYNNIPRNPLLHWFQDQINWSKYPLIFTKREAEFNEVWWFFPTQGEEEPNAYIIWNFEEGHFTNGTLSRTAAEEPTNSVREQYMANGACEGAIDTELFLQELDFSDNGENMSGHLTTNYTLIGEGDFIQQITRVIPSSLVLPRGDTTTETLYSLTVNTKEYDGQVTPRSFGAYDVLETTQKIDTRIAGRQRQYVYEFDNTCGFRIQKSYEEISTDRSVR